MTAPKCTRRLSEGPTLRGGERLPDLVIALESEALSMLDRLYALQLADPELTIDLTMKWVTVQPSHLAQEGS